MAFAKVGKVWKKTKNFVQRRLASRPVEQTILQTDNIAKVLVIGETGSGKSTFINYLTNYFKGGDLENLRIAIPSQFHPEPTEEFEWNERSVADNRQSQTDACHQYIFIEQQTNKQYLFLDSPGLGDTRGSDQDAVNMSKIIDAVEGLGDLTAVIIVVNGSVCREHLVIRNVVARLQGYLPHAVMKQVIVVLTNAKRHEATFDLKLLHLHGDVYPYFMQNAAFCSDPEEWDESVVDALQFDWDQSMEELAAIIETIDSFKATSVEQFTTMKEIRNKLKTLMHAARVQITEIQRMQDEIAMFAAALNQANENVVAFSNYSTHRIVEKVEIVDAPYHSTLCQNCNYVCHDGCHLDETSIVGSQIFKRCKAMDDSGTCKQCHHKCPYTAHYHAKATVKISEETLEDVIADIKAKYDSASNNKSTYEHEIATQSGAKLLLEKALQQKNEEIRHLCLELKRICPSFNLANELSALLDQLRVEASLLRDTTARENAAEFIRSLKLFCDSIESDQESSKTVLPGMKVMNTRRTDKTDFRRVSNESERVPHLTPPKTTHVDQSVIDLMKKLNVSSVSNRTETVTEQKPTTFTIDSHDKKAAEKSTLSQTATVTAEDLSRLTTKQLITQYKEKTDQPTLKLIFAELTRRSQGKSTGPIFAASDILMLTDFTRKYEELNVTALAANLYRVQTKVNEIIEPDIAQLAEVDSSLLSELCALQALLIKKSKEDEQTNNTQTFTKVISDSHAKSGQVHQRPPIKPSSKPSHNSPKVKVTDPVKKQRQHGKYFHNRSRSSSPPHVVRTDYTSDSEQSDSNNASTTSSHSSIPPRAPDANLPLYSDLLFPTTSENNSSIDERRSFSDNRLLVEYRMSLTNASRKHQHSLYNELERRCYGDYPELIEQQQTLFNQLHSTYSQWPKENITKMYGSVHKKIENLLGEEGAANIETLPSEWIIEAAVFTALLKEKS